MLSKDVVELRLLNSEPLSECDCVSDETGELGWCSWGKHNVIVEVAVSGMALGVGKSSLMGEATGILSLGLCGGALRTDICGASSIMVVRGCCLRAGTAERIISGGSISVIVVD